MKLSNRAEALMRKIGEKRLSGLVRRRRTINRVIVAPSCEAYSMLTRTLYVYQESRSEMLTVKGVPSG